MGAEFVYVTCFGHWNVLGDMMHAGVLHILVDLAWPLVILQSAMRWGLVWVTTSSRKRKNGERILT